MKDQREPTLNSGAFLAAIFIGLLAAVPLFLNTGFLNTRGPGESPYLLIRLQQLYTALSEGVFPVRWMPDAAFGLGYPFFNYYAALPYYFAAGLKALGFSYVTSLKLTQALGFAVAAGGMYAWIQAANKSSVGGLLAAAAYSFAPFHLVDVYLRGDMLSEFWAMAWLPLILLALYRAAERPSARRIILIGLSYGALAATHNISALIMSPFIGLYALVVGLTVRDTGLPIWKRMGTLLSGGLLGLALSAWVWLPALAEQGAVQIVDQTSGFFDYAAHFRTDTLVQHSVLYNYAAQPDSSPFAVGMVQAIFGGLGIAALLWSLIRDRRVGRDGFVVLGLSISLVMVTPLSTPIWESVPLLPLAQFPWRFLTLVAFFGAAATATLADVFSRWMASGQLQIGLMIGVTTILGVAAFARLPLDFIPLADADVTPARIWWYEAFTGDIGTTIRYEYLPVDVSPRPYTSDVALGSDPHAKFLEGYGVADRTAAKANAQTWRVEAHEASYIALPLHNWPGWQARVDGQLAATDIVKGSGWIGLNVPAGTHTVVLRLARTPLRLAAELAGLVGLGVVLILWRPTIPRLNWLEWGLVASGALWVTVALMVLHALPEPEPTGPLTADFDRQPYFYHIEDGLTLTDGSTMNIDKASTVLAPPPPLIPQGASIAATGGILTPGLYFPRLDPAVVARTTAGQPRGVVHLAPQVIPAYDGPLPTPDITSGRDFGIATLLGADTATEVGALHVTLWWWVQQEANQNYMIALRVRDPNGHEWAALDVQAGSAGLYPTGLWDPGEIIPDIYRLELPPGTPPSDYALSVALYERQGLIGIGETVLEGIRYDYLTPRSCAAAPEVPLDATVGIDDVSMPEAIQEGESLIVDVMWALLDRPSVDYQLRWTFASGEETIGMIEVPLASSVNSADWNSTGACGASVHGRYTVPIPADAPSGDYTVKLAVLNSAGYGIGELLAVGRISYQKQNRVFEVPAVGVPFVVNFGDTLKLWGYSLRQEPEALHIDTVWGALVDPPSDYKSFVHLYDPATNAIVSQIDSMPRNYTYPTSQWQTGEVVTETLTLDLTGVAPGHYRLGIGWYNPETADRLAARGPDDQGWTDDRVTLDEVIVVR